MLKNTRLLFTKFNSEQNHKKPDLANTLPGYTFYLKNVNDFNAGSCHTSPVERYMYDVPNFIGSYDSAYLIVANNTNDLSSHWDIPVKAFIPIPLLCKGVTSGSTVTLQGEYLEDVKSIRISDGNGDTIVPAIPIDDSTIRFDLPANHSSNYQISGITCDGNILQAYIGQGFQIAQMVPSGPVCGCQDCFETNRLDLDSQPRLIHLDSISPERVIFGETPVMTITGTGLQGLNGVTLSNGVFCPIIGNPTDTSAEFKWPNVNPAGGDLTVVGNSKSGLPPAEGNLVVKVIPACTPGSPPYLYDSPPYVRETGIMYAVFTFCEIPTNFKYFIVMSSGGHTDRNGIFITADRTVPNLYSGLTSVPNYPEIYFDRFGEPVNGSGTMYVEVVNLNNPNDIRRTSPTSYIIAPAPFF